MPNADFVTVAHARYRLECPLCEKAKGQVMITEPDGNHIKLECKTCGVLGTTEFSWDWYCPAGVLVQDHGAAAAEVLAVWLFDNPPNPVTQLAAIARRAGDA